MQMLSGVRDPAVQQLIDDITKIQLGKIKTLLEQKVKDGALDKKTYDGLMDDFRKTVRATKLPATSINMIALPSSPQEIPDPIDRAKRVKAEVEIDPMKRESARESGRRAIDRLGDEA